MKISNLANEIPLKITFLEVSSIVSICMNFQLLDIQSSVLETEHNPGLVSTPLPRLISSILQDSKSGTETILGLISTPQI